VSDCNAQKPKTRRRRRVVVPTGADIEAVNALAKILYAGGMASKSIGRPEAVAARIFAGIEVGLSPVQAVSGIMIVNGRASMFGDALLAVVRSSGEVESFAEGVDGDGVDNGGDSRVGWCQSKRVGVDGVVDRRFSVDDAKLAGLWGKSGPWTDYPSRMLQMRARAWVLRDLYGDILCGLGMVEEVVDYREGVATTAAATAPRLAGEGVSEPAGVITSKMVEAETTITAGASPVADKVDPETLRQIALARPSFLRGRGVDLDDAQSVFVEWTAVLGEFGVASARDLSAADGARLLKMIRDAGHEQEKREIIGEHAGTAQ